MREQHSDNNEDALLYQCDYGCLMRFMRKSQLQQHNIMCHTKAYLKCPDCNKHFSCNDQLRKHRRRMHPDLSNCKYICPKCSRCCNDSSYFDRHTQVCGVTNRKSRKSGTSNVTKPIKYKRSMVALIQEKVDDGTPEKIAILQVSKEEHIHSTKLGHWWMLREKHEKLPQTRRNASGSGRPLPRDKQLLFTKAFKVFDYERNQLQLPFGNADVCYFQFVCNSYKQITYSGIDNEKILWHDIMLFKKHYDIDEYAISSKKKYHSEYLTAVLGKWYIETHDRIKKDKILFENMLFCDETGVRMDFCMKNRTLSIKSKNGATISVENSKETLTCCIFWSLKRYVYQLHDSKHALYLFVFFLSVW